MLHKFHFHLLVIFLQFIQLGSIYSQEYKWDVSEPTKEGISKFKLQRIDKMLSNAIENNEIPGAVALIAKNGKIVYLKSFGFSDAKKSKLQTDAIFRIASQTKAITATAVMMLWEDGKFKLDDPIKKWIPEFSNTQILDSLLPDGRYTTTKAKNDITIRHLLTHTSGLGYGEIDADPRFRKIFNDADITELFTTENETIETMAKKAGNLPLHDNPGDKFTYGIGLDILGRFIEIVSGMPLDDYFMERIFIPLGMEDTYFYLPANKESRLVQVLTNKDGRYVPFKSDFYNVDFPKTGSKTYFSGGAGLTSTAEDYAKFLQMYLNKGEFNGKRLLSRKTVELIMSNQVEELWPNDGKYYGLAFSIVNSQGVSIGGLGSLNTFDWGGYFNTKYFADPEEQLIGILMKQTQGSNSNIDTTTEKFVRLIYSSIDN